MVIFVTKQTKEDNMKSKKGSVELIFIVLVGLMIWYGSTLTPEQQAQSRAECEKSFGSSPKNTITKWTNYSEMTDTEKLEMDKNNPYSDKFGK